ncbi:Receptor-like protein 7 [Sesamum alatum]|uniref:Receptor-like protein 7 n=1 Tax=Sesamum alatum TaxID=300844 RepID=A0AAE1XX46_9LAMI|nr:Receptor-like protein 7 [Sesamum alatum]
MKASKRTTAVLLFVLSFAANINLINSALCRETEKQALLIFKRALHDPSNLLASWDAAVDCCEWDGVLCHNLTGHVSELHLQSPDSGPGLGGKIDPSLLSLKHLRFLDLSQNDFTGTPIPGFFGSLVSLEYLNLSYAGFRGIIPHHLGNLSNLRTADLSGYSLEVDSLEWLSGLSHLEFLNFNYVNLSKVPDWLQAVNKLPNLIELHLSSCRLDYIAPLDNTNFSSLAVLDLSSNGFQSLVPNWIFSLTNLEPLQLQGNNFEGPIPSDQTNMTNLQFLDLSQNRFNSTLPYWLFNCRNLESVSLSINFLYGNISDSIVNLSSLRVLDLSSNELSGTIPWQVGNLCNLQVLELSFNKLQGDLSEIFGSSMSKCFLASLETLGVRGNRLSGQLTEQLGEFEKIQTLDLGNNSFTGPIPVSLGRLSSMTILRLDNNKLTGAFPLSFGQLSNLEVLVMENNMLEGVVTENHFVNLTKLAIISADANPLTLRVSEDWTPPFQLTSIFLNSWNLGARIPTWLRTQKSVSGLDLSCTGISGVIPKWFWNLSMISIMNLSHNQLSGELPDINGPNWVYLSSNKFSGPLPRVSYSVSELDLSNNSFSGGVSRILCSNRTNSLTILHLGRNQLSGEIPDCWMNSPSLQVINLGNNNLFGTIPGSMGLLGNLLSLNLYDNALSGKIPYSLQNCTRLIKLDLSGNKLDGDVPAWIGTSLSDLRILILRSNMLSGKIAQEICSLSFLHILDLADNEFSGGIPKCVDNLTAMSSESKLANFSRETYYSYFMGVFMESALLATKGSEFQYDTILSMFSSIDLSNNQLSGQVPEELTSLAGLRSLNLSGNHLTGVIPISIGKMGLLESLDLSRNRLSGEIPLSITGLNFLNYLNLSFNNLSGRIPVSTQLQSFGSSSFIGNELCGLPLPKNCTADGGNPGPKSSEEEDGSGSGPEIDWFYVSVALGFVVGLCGSCGTLIFKKSWRYAYFRFVDEMWRKVCGS